MKVMRMLTRLSAFLLVQWSLCALAARPPQPTKEWLPISPEEMAMKDDPSNPGAKAIVLYREVSNDDVKAVETEHYRIKVLTDDGRSYGDVQIPYAEKIGTIGDIQARVVQPDGRTVEFSGQVFDKLVVKGKKFQVQVKTFTLPEVRPGSIIEYSYACHRRWKEPDVLNHPKCTSSRARIRCPPRIGKSRTNFSSGGSDSACCL